MTRTTWAALPGGFACLADDLVEPRFVDAETPPPAGGWAYLVAGETEGGRGPLGWSSRGAAPEAGGCP